ncbi:MAG: PilX N-terminal domain-containing pilus assembly protein [Hydrogenophaga sp.]|nr:PilX N-terminal domain-containing pilus assembly protein [Hydrogenophaga sp.]
MKNLHDIRLATLRRERGAALIISMILLVLITLVGVASLRNVLLEEKMAANYKDRSLAFQAAEAGLRAGEAVAAAQASTSPKHAQAIALGFPADATQCSSTCSGGLCSPPGAPALPGPPAVDATFHCEGRWEMSGFTGWANATGVTLNTQAGSAPQYFVEFMGNTFPCDPSQPTINKTCARYRVTARSQSGDDRAQVILQSVYATE